MTIALSQLNSCWLSGGNNKRRVANGSNSQRRCSVVSSYCKELSQEGVAKDKTKKRDYLFATRTSSDARFNEKGGETKMEMKDKIIGRPIRLNQKVLEVKSGKDYSEVVFFGDLHLGARECDLDRAKAMLDYCLQKGVYIFLMGDLLEAGLRTSVGSSVYRQKLNPQEQLEEVIELLEPLVKEGLILGSLEGNHELRIEKETGIAVMKVICRILGIPYLRCACWNLWRVGKEIYRVYALHGASWARFSYTKLKAVVDISHSFDADLIAMGHTHSLIDDAQLVQYVDSRSKTVKERKKFLVLTGSYLAYDGSYVQEHGYPLTKLGSPKVKFFADKHDIHVSY